MKIVVAVDGSANADHALRWAKDEAALHSASLTVLHAYGARRRAGAPGGDGRSPGLQSEADELVRAVIDRVLGDARDATIAVQPVVGRQVASAVLHHSRDADLLVLGSRGLGGFPGLLLGSVSQQVAAHATVPVAIVPTDRITPQPPAATSVVVGVDGSVSSCLALEWGFVEAGVRDVPVQAVLVRPPVDPVIADATAETLGALDERADERAREELSAIVTGTLGAAGHSAGIRVVAGQAARVLVDDAADPATLLVVGSRGRGGFVGLVLGSVGLQCLTHATGPVVVVHAP